MPRSQDKYQQKADSVVRLNKQNVGIPSASVQIACSTGTAQSRQRALRTFQAAQYDRVKALAHWPEEYRIRYGYLLSRCWVRNGELARQAGWSKLKLEYPECFDHFYKEIEEENIKKPIKKFTNTVLNHEIPDPYGVDDCLWRS